MHAVSGLHSTTLLCQSEYCDKFCQAVHTYNHLLLPHTKACEQTRNLFTKKEEKDNNSKIFLGKVYSNFAVPVAFAELGLSLRNDRCVPAQAPVAMQRRTQKAPQWDGTSGWLMAGSVSQAGRGKDPHFHPAGMVTNASALWRPLNISNSRTCAEATRSASLKTKLISHNRTAHALDI